MSEIIALLNQNNISVDKGLDSEEIEGIQSLYGIRFPKSLVDYLQEGMPRFYLYALTFDNVTLIQEAER